MFSKVLPLGSEAQFCWCPTHESCVLINWLYSTLKLVLHPPKSMLSEPPLLLFHGVA